MITFKQIQDDLLIKLKEDATDPRFWKEPEIKNAINDAYMFIADECLCFRLDYIINVRAGFRIYKLPQNYVMGSLNRVEFDSKVITPVSSKELDIFNRSWRSESGSIIKNYIPPGDICNFDEIATYPLPDTNGAEYNTVTGDDTGEISDIDSEQFTQDEGVVTSTDGEESQFSESYGAVFEIKDPTNNLRVFGAKYPKRLYNENDVCLNPISENPRSVLTHGALATLYEKDGEGKDIQKSSYHYKRFNEILVIFNRNKNPKRMHKIRSISDYVSNRSVLNLGEHYGAYIK